MGEKVICSKCKEHVPFDFELIGIEDQVLQIFRFAEIAWKSCAFL
jgi:hypothetical protein